MTPHILFVTNARPWPPFGGQFIRTYNLIESLSRHFAVGVVAPSVSAECPLTTQTQAWFDLPDPTRISLRELRQPRPAWAACLETAYRQWQPQVTWFDFAYWGSYARQARRHGAKLILGRHNIQPDITRQRVQTQTGLPRWAGWGRYWLERAHEKITYPQFDRLITVTETDQAYYARRLGAERVRLIPNYIHEDWYAVQPPPRREPATLALTANFHSYQNAAGARWFLESVWPRLLAIAPEARLELVGDGGAELLAQAGVTGNVQADGPVRSVAPYLRRATVAVVPILHGSGSRFKVLEALACDTPLVSTTLGAQGLMVRAGEEVWLADDSAEFAAAIARLLHDPAYCQRLADNGRQLLRREYGFVVNTERARRVVDELLNGDAESAESLRAGESL